MYKRIVSFKDDNGNIFTVRIKIEDGELSMVGKGGHGCGQCQDSIVPKNIDQERIVRIWNKWHLNNMHAGTEKQENAKNAMGLSGYGETVKYLKSIGLYVDHTQVPGYVYGTAWLRKELPDNIETILNSICDDIEKKEADEVEGCYLTEMDDDDILALQDNYSNEVIALGLVLELTDVDLEEIEEDGNCLCYGGYDYFVGTYDEAENEARSYLTDDPYFWQMAVENGDTVCGLEEWADEVINIDGIGHILNSWDGSEYEVRVNGKYYVICRR